MEYLGAAIIALIGAVFILIRDLYAKFILSFFCRIPAVKQREKSILRWISAIAVVGGVAFILIGVLLAISVASWRRGGRVRSPFPSGTPGQHPKPGAVLHVPGWGRSSAGRYVP